MSLQTGTCLANDEIASVAFNNDAQFSMENYVPSTIIKKA
jgi:hypothetical protein